MKFNWFFNKGEDGDMTGGAANTNTEFSAADFSDDDFFIDVETWGEKIAWK